MKDGLHIVAVSECLTLSEEAKLKPASLLTLDPDFEAAVAQLGTPRDYHAFIQAYGTHYVKAVRLGSAIRMKTVIKHDYFSRHSDADIEANLQAAWAASSHPCGSSLVTGGAATTFAWDANTVSTFSQG